MNSFGIGYVDACSNDLLVILTDAAWPCTCMSAWTPVGLLCLDFRTLWHNLACLFWFRLQACLASAKLPSFGRYSFVT